MWPGYGENMRVLEWIVDRCHGRVNAAESRIGWVPRFRDFDLHGLDGFNEESFNSVQKIDDKEWHLEALSQEEFFMKLWSRLPKELMLHRELLVSRL